MTREEAMDCMRAHMEYPKSICTMCKYRYATQPCEVRTAYKMAADALDERPMIDRVLEIIDDEIKKYNEKMPSGAWACQNIRGEVLKLKGEQE